MFSNTFKRLSFIAAAILATFLGAALPSLPAASQRTSLAGQLLIAAPNMGDPRFYQTVVLLVLHDRNGAMGIVVNRPLEERPLASLLEVLGETATGVAGSVRIFAGGPVQPELGFVLHSADYHRPDTRDRRPSCDDVEPRDPARYRQWPRPEAEPGGVRLCRLGTRAA